MSDAEDKEQGGGGKPVTSFTPAGIQWEVDEVADTQKPSGSKPKSDKSKPDKSKPAISLVVSPEEELKRAHARKYLKAWLPPDEGAVLAGCARVLESVQLKSSFLEPINAHYRDLIFSVMLRVGAPLVARQRILDTYRGHLGFDELTICDDMDFVLAATSGPAVCSAISEACGGKCERDCVHWADKQVTSPIKIKGEDHISTQATGFWFCEMKDGSPVPKKPDVDGLCKYFTKLHESRSTEEAGITYYYEDCYWKLAEQQRLKSFCYTQMNPKPRENTRVEFASTLRCFNLFKQAWFDESTTGLINLANGVFDIEHAKLLEHGSRYGFRYILPYEYDPNATCPVFDQFLEDVTMGREDVAQVLVEFMGYALAGGPCFAEKALFLSGEGSNGKSTYMKVLKALAGDENYSAMTLSALNNPQNRYAIDGKLFNLGQETNPRALGESEIFKTMVTGEEIDVKRLYSNPYIIKNRCKLIVACNELPKSSDRSEGLYRRLIFVPFEAEFTKTSQVVKDPEIEYKLYKELPGIFNRCVEGYRRLKKQHWEFSSSLTLDAALSEYKKDNDNIYAWFKAKVEVTGQEDHFLYKDMMYSNYEDFCDSEGCIKMNKPLFFKSVKRWGKGKITEARRRMPDGTRARIWNGVRFSYNED